MGSKNSRYQGIENVTRDGTVLSEPLVHETEKQSVRLMFPEYIERAVLPAKGGGMEITMRDMWIYAVIPVLYCLLFLSVRGGFQKASKWIGENVFSEFEIETAAIRKALIAVFLANIAAALITVSGRMNSTVRTPNSTPFAITNPMSNPNPSFMKHRATKPKKVVRELPVSAVKDLATASAIASERKPEATRRSLSAAASVRARRSKSSPPAGARPRPGSRRSCRRSSPCWR